MPPAHRLVLIALSLFFCLLPSLAMAQSAAPANQTLDSAISGIKEGIEAYLNSDRAGEFKGSSIQLDRISSSGAPDANFDSALEDKIQIALKDWIKDKAPLLLKTEYSYLTSDSLTNKDRRVIQVGAKLISSKSGKIVLGGLVKEINNTSDMNRILGNTVSPPDTKNYEERLEAVEAAYLNPTFELHSETEITQVASDAKSPYRVGILRRTGGTDHPEPVEPENRGGLVYMPVEVADFYEIVLYNYDPNADAVAKIDIDGLDVINTFCVDTDSTGRKIEYPGYWISRATPDGPGKHVVRGWLRTIVRGNDNIYPFVVTELGQGAATSRAVKGKIGMITIRFFDSYKEGEKPRPRSFGETGLAEPQREDLKQMPSIIASEPVSQVTVRYLHDSN